MIHYFVSETGDEIETEDVAKGYYAKDSSLFTQKQMAIVESKRRLRLHIKELQAVLERRNQGDIE
jgi:hypothetical protein